MSEQQRPIVVDLGKRKRKDLDALDRGFGPAADEVQEAVEGLREALGEEAADLDIVPVVVVYKRKRRRPLFGKR